MKSLLGCGIGLLALTAGPVSVNAADLPLMPAPAGSIYSWSGFYVGGTVGGAWGTLDPVTSTSFVPLVGYFGAAGDVGAVNAAGVQRINRSGVTVGAEAGYNWQFGNIVAGIEADIESIRLSGSAVSGPNLYASVPSTFTIASSASANWLFTTRPRIGWAANNWLFYATGGLAVTNLNAVFAFNDTFASAVEGASISNTRLGYTVGGGIEAGLWDRWTLKVEYLYVNFNSVSVTSTNLVVLSQALATVPIPAQQFTHSVDLKANIARVGLNYRF